MRKKKDGMPERSGAPVVKVTTGAWWKSALDFLPKRMLTPGDGQGGAPLDEESDVAENESALSTGKVAGTGGKVTEPGGEAVVSAEGRAEPVVRDIDLGDVPRSQEISSVSDAPAAHDAVEGLAEDMVDQGDPEGRKSGRRSRRGRGRRGRSTAAAEAQPLAGDAPEEAGPAETEAAAARGAAEEPLEGERGRLKLLINAEEPEECRVALVENGRLEAFHIATETMRPL